MRPAVAALGSALILLAGSATADAAATTTTTAAAKAVVANPFSVSVHHIQQGRLMPGGPGRSFEFSVTNHGSKAEPVDIRVQGLPHGAVPIFGPGVSGVTGAIQVLRGQDAVLMGFGGDGGRGFVGVLGQRAQYVEGWAPLIEIPARTTFTWRFTLAATSGWPVNDDGLKVRVAVRPGYLVGPVRTAWSRAWKYRVGTARTGGPLVQSLTGPRELRAGRPVVFDWTVTNRTGAALSLAPDRLSFGLEYARSGWQMPTYRYELWDGHHWRRLGTTWVADLPSPGRLANGAGFHYRIRVTLGGKAPNPSVRTLDFAANLYDFDVPALAVHHFVVIDRG